MPYDKTRDRHKAIQAADPVREVSAVTPDDANDLPVYSRALYIGTSGDVKVIPVGNADDQAVTYKNRPIGDMPVRVRRVLATGTTAANILNQR